MTSRFGIDTNILLRIVVDDDVEQKETVKRLLTRLEDGETLLVSLAVILETAWVLGQFYGYPKSAVLEFFQLMLERRELEIPNYEAIGNAIDICRNTNADFSDAIVSESNRVNGCVATYTFDKKAARKLPGMELLT
ncbi:PIN domain-containing protein [Agrobacterium sp. 22-226-1]